MRAKVNINKNWASQLLRQIEVGLVEMVTDIDRRAKILAPVDTRALVNSAMIRRLGAMAYAVSFGSSRVPYARRRHFENKKNPQTLGYLAKAADGVMRGDKGRYFRSKIK